MIITVFRSRLTPGLEQEYLALVARMRELAEKMPGYIGHKGFWAEDGERVTIVQFENEDAQRAWRTHPEHVAAQRLGREKYYTEYDITVCEAVHHSHFERKASVASGT